MRLLGAVLSASSTLLASSTLAWAGEALRVVIIASDAASTTSRRLEAELRNLGLEVLVTSPKSDTPPTAPFEQVPGSENAIAVVQVVEHGTKADLWIADRVTRKTVVRQIVTNARTRDRIDDSIAVGVAELLRASLMEVHARAPSVESYPVTQRIRELAYPPATSTGSSVVWVSAGAGALLEARGVGVAAVGQLALGWQSDIGVGIEVLAGTTLTAGKVERPEGRATVSSQWIGSGATLNWQAPASNLSVRAGLGVAAARVEADGEAVEPYTSATSAVWRGGPYLHAGPALGLGPVRLRLDFAALLLIPETHIRFADEPIATWGQPSLFMSLALEGFIANAP